MFLFLGIWDVMSNEEVVDFVRSRIAKRMSPELVCFVGCNIGICFIRS